MDDYNEASQCFAQQETDRMNADDVKVLISFYADNLIQWNASRPQYRSYFEKNKDELVKALDSRFSNVVLEKKFQSLRTSRLHIRFFSSLS